MNLGHREDDINPFASLDILYNHIVKSSPQPDLALRWLSWITDTFQDEPRRFTRQILERYPGQAFYLFENWASLLDFEEPSPSQPDEKSPPYHVYHKSFIDFLHNPRRCGEIVNQWFSLDCNTYEEALDRVFKGDLPSLLHTIDIGSIDSYCAARSPFIALPEAQREIFVRDFMEHLLYNPLNLEDHMTLSEVCHKRDWWPILMTILNFSSYHSDGSSASVGHMFTIYHHSSSVSAFISFDPSESDLAVILLPITVPFHRTQEL